MTAPARPAVAVRFASAEDGIGPGWEWYRELAAGQMGAAAPVPPLFLVPRPAGPEPEAARPVCPAGPAARRRCRTCGYQIGAAGHKIACGTGVAVPRPLPPERAA